MCFYEFNPQSSGVMSFVLSFVFFHTILFPPLEMICHLGSCINENGFFVVNSGSNYCW